MVYIDIHLTSSDHIFGYYSLSKKILGKNYEIAMILNGGIINSNLESKINMNVVRFPFKKYK